MSLLAFTSTSCLHFHVFVQPNNKSTAFYRSPWHTPTRPSRPTFPITATAEQPRTNPSPQSTSNTEQTNTISAKSHTQLSDHLLMLIFGLTASTVGSLIGAGGGMLLTPLLTAYGLPQHRAHGTSLCVITVTALISTIKYLSASQVDVYAAVALTLTAVLTSPLGARQSARVDAPTLKKYFGIFLLFVSVLIPLLPYMIHHLPVLSIPLVTQRILLAAVGACTGFLAGLLGIGGGTVNVPVLVLFAGFSQKLAQGTSMAAMFVPSVRASFTHFGLAQVAVSLLPGLALGAVMGGSIGTSLALYLPENALRVVCSFVFASLGVKYLTKGGKSKEKSVDKFNGKAQNEPIGTDKR